MNDTELSDPQVINQIYQIMKHASNVVINRLNHGDHVLLHCTAGTNRSVAVAVMVYIELNNPLGTHCPTKKTV